jgi:SHS2 domain-containing protein
MSQSSLDVTPGSVSSHWEHFPHDADVGIRGIGSTLECAFEQAAVALTATITAPSNVAPRIPVSISCDGTDTEVLFIEWLNSIVYEMATRHMLFNRYHVRVQGDHLNGTAWGERIDSERHQPAAEVKGATFTELAVRRDASGHWTAQCVLDV